MERKDAEVIILGHLYDSYFQDDEAVNLNILSTNLEMDNVAFWNLVDQMCEQGLIKARSLGGNYRISSMGVLKAENANVGAETLKEENQRLRTLILNKLAEIYNEKGSHADGNIEPMANEFGADVHVLVRNFQILKDVGFVESVAMGSFKITIIGLKAVDEWRERTSLEEEYEMIAQLEPHVRGRKLQKVIAKAIENEGWSQNESVRTSHEEMDVVIHRAREYFVIECKWEKDPIEAAVVRELHGKLSNRIGVEGILISLSGYSSGAVEQAENYASDRVILLFGKEDTERLIYQRESFETLLNEKYQRLITHRQIVYK